MMTFISCAKTMTGRSKMQTPVTSTPQFQTEAIQNALDMSQFSAEELERLLRVNSKIAAENYMRFQDFCSDSPSALAALLAYTGIVYKRIHPQDFFSLRITPPVRPDQELQNGRRYQTARTWRNIHV